MIHIDVPTILRAMAAHATTVPGIKRGVYPPENIINARECPALVFYWAGDEDTVLMPSSASGGVMWLPQVKAQLLAAPRRGDTVPEFALSDSLLTPIVDAYTRPSREWPRGTDAVTVTRLRPSLLIDYAGSTYAGAEIFFSLKFHRSRRVQ